MLVGHGFCEKHRLSTTPVSSVPCQIIGFNPVGKEADAVGSPRSVLCRIRSGRSPTSPRSGLESLLSSPPSCEKNGRDAVGRSGVPSLSTKKVDVAGNSKVNKLSPKQSNPISIIGQPKSQCSSSFRGQKQLFNESFQEAVAWRLRSSQCGTNLRQEDLNGALTDLETFRRKSIFSTTSPASSCSDRNDSILEIDFLNACHFCKLQLVSGKDIYMYRGDRAFCSVECRYQYIVLDERNDRCTSSVQSFNTKYRRKVLSSTQAAAA